MIALIIYPLLFAIVGALMYALAANGKVQELGRIMFFCGVLWLVWLLTDKSFRIG